MGKELEWKFASTQEQLQRLQIEIDGDETRYQMQTTYYDTADGLLSQRRCTLRCRLENGRKVCTFKTPVSDTERGEFDVSDLSLEEALPALAEASGVTQLLTLAQSLQQVCGARFVRIAKQIREKDFEAELALDEGVLLGGGRQIPLCEVELEYKSGDEEAFSQYAQAFGLQHGLQTEKRSKFARAMALAKGE